MQDGVKRFRRVTSVEVAACVLPVAMEQQRFATAEEVDELRNDLCMLLVFFVWTRLVSFAHFLDTGAGPSRY